MSKFNVQTKFNPDKEKTILELTDKLGLKLKTSCGGKGKCGKCAIQIIDGDLNPPTKEEEKLLKKSELENGVRLACCAVPAGDITIRTEIKDKK